MSYRIHSDFFYHICMCMCEYRCRLSFIVEYATIFFPKMLTVFFVIVVVVVIAAVVQIAVVVVIIDVGCYYC